METEYERFTLGDNASAVVFDGALVISVGNNSGSGAVITASIAGGETERRELQIGERITIVAGTTIYDIIYSQKTFFANTGIIACMTDGNGLWDNIASGNSTKPLEFDDIDSNDPFSNKEKEDIKTSLNRLHEAVSRKFGSTKAEEKTINDKLDYIVDTLNRQGKKDWTHTSIGVFATLASSLGLSGEQAAMFWQMVKDIFGVPIRLLMGE